MKKNFFVLSIVLLYVVFLFISLQGCVSDNNIITINIGYQSVTSQTWGALVMKNQSLFERKLEEKFPLNKIQVNWYNEVSGAAINANMISGKYQLGFMGDMPCLINGYNGSGSNGYESILVAIDGKGLNGKNQGIVVSKTSQIKEVSDLAGKTISVPVGSSAHNMLLQILNKYNLNDKVTILHQDITVASSLLKTNKTDAFAVWDPYPRLLLEDDSLELLIDGSESGIDYLTGIMANKNWANNYSDILVVFLESLLEAHSHIIDNPELAAKIFVEETNFPESIALHEAKEIRWDAVIYHKDRLTLERSLKFLVDIEQINEFDLNGMIDTSYINIAVENLKMNPIDFSLQEWPDYLY